MESNYFVNLLPLFRQLDHIFCITDLNYYVGDTAVPVIEVNNSTVGLYIG